LIESRLCPVGDLLREDKGGGGDGGEAGRLKAGLDDLQGTCYDSSSRSSEPVGYR